MRGESRLPSEVVCVGIQLEPGPELDVAAPTCILQIHIRIAAVAIRDVAVLAPRLDLASGLDRLLLSYGGVCRDAGENLPADPVDQKLAVAFVANDVADLRGLNIIRDCYRFG